MKILVTGAAGFIGFHTAKKLLESGHTVVGLDNLNTYYDKSLKNARLAVLKKHPRFIFYKIDLQSKKKLRAIFEKHRFGTVLHFGAQAGVRYSIDNPDVYIASNLVGFFNMLENCKDFKIRHLIYASSSTVYGLNKDMPFKIGGDTDHPASLYGATKKANELMAHVYHHLHGLQTTGLRFFTVYGPWGRPDLGIFVFTKNILERKTVRLFNYGKTDRDFTYIDDIVKGILTAVKKGPRGYKLYNLGNSRPENILHCVRLIEKLTGIQAKIHFESRHKADLPKTFADIRESKKDLNFSPKTRLEEGLKKFLAWYRAYYKI